MGLKVSSVMCTYGRFNTVRQSTTFWKYQDYENKELIIFNTAPIPIELDDSLKGYNIKVVNQQTELGTDKKYDNLGRIREDALTFTTGDLYSCWDDDDMFLPWHLSQCVKNLQENDLRAWMPAQSYWSPNNGESFDYARNSMEAAVIVYINEIKKYGFAYKNGLEHLPWRRGMLDDGLLSENDEVTPYESYAYIWGSQIAPHKTSGNVSDPDNFENHKDKSVDFGEGEKLTFVSPEHVERLFINVYKSKPSEELRVHLKQYLTTLDISPDKVLFA